MSWLKISKKMRSLGAMTIDKGFSIGALAVKGNKGRNRTIATPCFFLFGLIHLCTQKYHLSVHPI